VLSVATIRRLKSDRPSVVTTEPSSASIVWPNTASATSRSGHVSPGASNASAIGAAVSASAPQITPPTVSLSRIASTTSARISSGSSRRSAMNRVVALTIPKSAGRNTSPPMLVASAKSPYPGGWSTRTSTSVSTAVSPAVVIMVRNE
jgi:hypothetical protein